MDVYTDGLLWMAWCSNKSRTVTECLQRTHELIEKYKNSEKENVWNEISRYLITIAVNRGNDIKFLQAMFSVDSKEVAVASLEALVDLSFRGIEIPEIMQLWDLYTKRYGEDKRMLTSKLSYISQSKLYMENEPEIERILEKLNNL